MKNKPDLKFLEIGSFEGRSAVWVLENILTDKSSKLTCIDTFEGSIEHHTNEQYTKLLPTLYDIFTHNVSFFKDQTIVKRGMSQDIMKHLYCQNNKYDFIYIDGDHMATSALEDAILGFGLLKVGGIMCFDDYHAGLENPDDNLEHAHCAIDAFLKIYRNKIVVLHKAYQVMLRKIAE